MARDHARLTPDVDTPISYYIIARRVTAHAKAPSMRHPVLHRPQKKSNFAVFLHNSTTGSTATCVFLLRDIPSLCHNFSYTFDPKMHHPAMDS